MEKKIKEIFCLFILVSLGVLLPLFDSFVFAQDSYQVNKNGGIQKIDKHGVCKMVINNRADYNIFVPVKTENEWLEFRIYRPANVVLDECGICYGVANNTQVPGCDGTCQACQSGSCGVAYAGSDPGSDCSASGCGTGNCMGGSAECGYYTSGDGSCPTCQTCVGAGSPSCVNYANNTQDSGCSGTCQACQYGSCGAADSGTDPGNRCPSAGYNDAATGCATGDCKGGSAECGYYTSDWYGNCPTCKTCNGATSPACANVPNNTQVWNCDGTCQACQSGSCGVAYAGSDPGYDCWTFDGGCATGDCKGGSAECGYYTSDWYGNCSICRTCQGAVSVNCVPKPIDTPSQYGCYFCDGMGNNKHCAWDWPFLYPSSGSERGSIDCKPSTEGSYGYMDNDAYNPGYSCGTFGSYVGWGYDSIWYAECECW